MSLKVSRKKYRTIDEIIASGIEGNVCNISWGALTKVPVHALKKHPEIEILNLHHNSLTMLGNDFPQLINLTRLDISNNLLVTLPSNFGCLRNLRSLDLCDNNIVALPSSFAELVHLRFLDIRENPLLLEMRYIVGYCESVEACEKCAVLMVKHMQQLNEQQVSQPATTIATASAEIVDNEVSEQATEKSIEAAETSQLVEATQAVIELTEELPSPAAVVKSANDQSTQVAAEDLIESSAHIDKAVEEGVAIKAMRLLVISIMLALLVFMAYLFYKAMQFTKAGENNNIRYTLRHVEPQNIDIQAVEEAVVSAPLEVGATNTTREANDLAMSAIDNITDTYIQMYFEEMLSNCGEEPNVLLTATDSTADLVYELQQKTEATTLDTQNVLSDKNKKMVLTFDYIVNEFEHFFNKPQPAVNEVATINQLKQTEMITARAYFANKYLKCQEHINKQNIWATLCKLYTFI